MYELTSVFLFCFLPPAVHKHPTETQVCTTLKLNFLFYFNLSFAFMAFRPKCLVQTVQKLFSQAIHQYPVSFSLAQF